MRSEMSASDMRQGEQLDLSTLRRMPLYLTVLSHVFLPTLFTLHLLPVASAVVVGDDCNDDWVWGECIPWSYDSKGCGIDGRQEARREGAGCHIIAFTMKCTPECPSPTSIHGGNAHLWRNNYPGINFPMPTPTNYDVNNNYYKTLPPDVDDYGKAGTGDGSYDKYPNNGKGEKVPGKPGEPISGTDSHPESLDYFYKTGGGKAEDPKSDKTMSKEISEGKESGKTEDDDTSETEWGISQLEKPSAGCEYAAPSEWSECDRNGHKYRSKKLVSGPPVCSQVVEEVEQCRRSSPVIVQDLNNYNPKPKPNKPFQPNAPTEKKLPIPTKSNKDTPNGSVPRKQPTTEENEEKMPKDEPPPTGVDSVGAVVRPQAEKTESTCTYTKFSPWGKCVDGQKSRVQTLRYGPDTCTGQNTEYKRCTKGRNTGCKYVREDKTCDKCSWEKPGFKICRAPLDKSSSKSSCERSLVIEKPC